jgi:hypothetical protein
VDVIREIPLYRFRDREWDKLKRTLNKTFVAAHLPDPAALSQVSGSGKAKNKNIIMISIPEMV